MKRTTELRRSAPLLPCGPGWPTKEKAEQAAGDSGREVFRCLNRACTRWHLRDAPGARRLLSAVAPVRPLRRRDTGPSARVRLQVYERDGYCCACCGQSVIGRPHSVGHRKRRSQGGTNTPDNLLTFLGYGNGITGDEDHHYRIDRRTDPLDEERGLTVRRHLDPALVPVKTRREDGSLLAEWLTVDGLRTAERPEAAA